MHPTKKLFPLGAVSASVLLLSGLATGQVARPAATLSGSSSFSGGVVADGAVAVTLWRDNASGELFAARSQTCGATFGAGVRVDSDLTGASKSFGLADTPSLALSGDHVYATWVDDRSGLGRTYVARSTDQGLSFEADVELDGGVLGMPVEDRAMAVVKDPLDPTDDRIYVLQRTALAGLTDELFLVVSPDGGGTYSQALRVRSSLGVGDVDDLAVAASGLTAFLVWVDDRTGVNEVYFRVSKSGGLTFGPELMLSAAGGTGEEVLAVGGSAIHVDCDGDRVFVAWQQENALGEHVLVGRYSEDCGQTFDATFPISNGGAGSDLGGTEAAIVDDQLFCLWTNLPVGSGTVAVSPATAGAISFTHSPLTIAPQSPRLAAEDDFLAIVGSAAGFPLLYYDTDPGPAIVLSNLIPLAAQGNGPRVAVAPDNVVAVWQGTGTETLAGGVGLIAAETTFYTAGPNVPSYTAGKAIIGNPWSVSVNAAMTGHSDAVLLVFSDVIDFPLSPGGDHLLVTGVPFFAPLFLPGPAPATDIAVPNDACFQGLKAYTQALHLGGAGGDIRWTNGQELTLGSF